MAAAVANQSVEQKIDVTSRWKKLTDHINHLKNDVSVPVSWTFGSHSLLKHNKWITAPGTSFQILYLEAELTENDRAIMYQSEIYNSNECSATVNVKADSRFIRYQLVNEVAGHEIAYDHFVDTPTDDCSSLRSVKCTATILVRKVIHFGRSFRLMHKKTKKYVEIVSRKKWPAATLGTSNPASFQLTEVSEGIYKVKILNTPYSGYDVMYSAEAGGIYFDESSSNEKQLWTMSKAPPFYEEDVVTFTNVHWPQAGLCHHEGEHTNVYCMNGRADEWIMELIA